MTNTVPLSLLAQVEAAWPVEVVGRSVEELGGGQESTVVRVGDVVVRIGPEWRPTDEAAWCYALAESLHDNCSEAVPPMRSRSSLTAARIVNRPVSLWPYVEGTSGDRADAAQREQAATTLARLHRAALHLTVPKRPPMSAPTVAMDSLADSELDAWLTAFRRDRRQHALHGDFYPGNVLVSAGRLVGVVDWDEAVVDAPEVELAVAACEWGGVFVSGDLEGAVEFVAAYLDEGGTAERIDPETIGHLYRARLRSELTYEEHQSGPLESLSDEARAYRLRQLALYNDLKS